MPLEQEFPQILTTTFIITITIIALVTIALWIRSKQNGKAYSMMLLHLVLMSSAFYYFHSALTSDFNHPMASEENTLQLWIAGGFWLASMGSLLLAIVFFSTRVLPK
jgi:hypothetical protein